MQPAQSDTERPVKEKQEDTSAASHLLSLVLLCLCAGAGSGPPKEHSQAAAVHNIPLKECTPVTLSTVRR